MVRWFWHDWAWGIWRMDLGRLNQPGAIIIDLGPLEVRIG